MLKLWVFIQVSQACAWQRFVNDEAGVADESDQERGENHCRCENLAIEDLTKLDLCTHPLLNYTICKFLIERAYVGKSEPIMLVSDFLSSFLVLYWVTNISLKVFTLMLSLFVQMRQDCPASYFAWRDLADTLQAFEKAEAHEGYLD